MAGNIGDWQGFVKEYKLEELYIFDDEEEVRFVLYNCKLSPIL